MGVESVAGAGARGRGDRDGSSRDGHSVRRWIEIRRRRHGRGVPDRPPLPDQLAARRDRSRPARGGRRLGRVRLLPLRSSVLRVRQLRPDGGRRVARRLHRADPDRGAPRRRGRERGNRHRPWPRPPGRHDRPRPSGRRDLARRRKRRSHVLERFLLRSRRRPTASRSRRGQRGADRGGGALDAAGRLSRRARRRGTFGFSEVAFVSAAFGDFGSMGAGAWIEACGSVLLLGGIVAPQLVGSSAPAPAPAHAG